METPEELVILGKHGTFWPIPGQACYVKKKGGKVLHKHADSSVEVKDAVYYGGRELFEKNLGLFLPLACDHFYRLHMESGLYWCGYLTDTRFPIFNPSCAYQIMGTSGELQRGTEPFSAFFIDKKDAWDQFTASVKAEDRVQWPLRYKEAFGMIQGSADHLRPSTKEKEEKPALPPGVPPLEDGYEFCFHPKQTLAALGKARCEMALLPKKDMEGGWIYCKLTTVDLSTFEMGLKAGHPALKVQPGVVMQKHPGLTQDHVVTSKYCKVKVLPSAEEVKPVTGVVPPVAIRVERV